MQQNIAESVSDYLSRIIKTASIKNVPEKVLLSVAMNGLRSDIKTFVVTQNPKSMEQLRQTAILAEKSQPPQISTSETYENLLAEIKNLQNQLSAQNASINTIQQVAPQTSYQNQQNLLSEPRMRNAQPIRFTQMRPQQYNNRNTQMFRSKRPSFQPRPQPPPPQVQSSCSYCLNFCMTRQNCPARDAVCYVCGKIGHFSRACRFAAKPTK
jgi:hypothetical protein